VLWQDFFALMHAAAVVVWTPKGWAQESSFSTVSALAGDVPLLLPYPRKRSSKAIAYERFGNDGRAMRGFFWLDDLHNGTFLRAVDDPKMRHRRPPSVQSFITRSGAVGERWRGERWDTL
jgi:hypothetical protein